MKTNAVRIYDKEGGDICVTLEDILKEIHNGNMLQWSILYLEATGNLGEGKSIIDFEKKFLILKKVCT